MKSEKALDKTLPGAVVPQYRTVNGKRYGPYWTRVWRKGGKVHTAYVKPGELEAVRAACERNRRLRRKVATTLRQVRETRGDFALLMRLLRRMDAQGRVVMSEEELRRAERFTGKKWGE